MALFCQSVPGQILEDVSRVLIPEELVCVLRGLEQSWEMLILAQLRNARVHKQLLFSFNPFVIFCIPILVLGLEMSLPLSPDQIRVHFPHFSSYLHAKSTLVAVSGD